MMNFHKDDQLIKKVKNGDEEAFNSLYQKYYKTMLYTAYRLTNNMEDAKDAVQAAFLQMYRSIGNLKDPKYFRLWMNKIVRGKCIDIFHKNRSVIIDLNSEETINEFREEHRDYLPHEQLQYTADRDILMHLMAKLPYHYREILIDAYFLQFTMKEMADLLDLPVGTVKSRLYAAKKALRKEVDEYEEQHDHKLTFRSFGILPLALLLAFNHERKAWNLIGKEKRKMAEISMICAATLAVCGILAATDIGKHIDQPVNNESDILLQSNSMTCREAYFTLRYWANDAVQMSEKTDAEIQMIQPIYEYLKQHQGPYWERIQAEGWDRAYETLR